MDFAPEFVREFLPIRPIALRAAVLDTDDGIPGAECGIEIHQFIAGQLAAGALFKDVVAVARVKFRTGCVEREKDLFARLVAGVSGRLQNRFNRGFGAVEFRRETAFIADRRGQPLLLQHRLERMENLGGGAQRLGKSVEAFRHDHELLKINRCVRVRAAIDDVGHRHGQNPGVGAAQIFEQRLADRRRGGFGIGQRHGEDRVGPEFGFRFGAVEFEHDAVHRELVERVHTAQRGQNFFSHVPDRFGNAFAQITPRVAVPQLERLVLAGAGAGRDGRASRGAVFQYHIHFNGGIAARVENLAGLNVANGAHS